jgi:hypothetical protein
MVYLSLTPLVSVRRLPVALRLVLRPVRRLAIVLAVSLAAVMMVGAGNARADSLQQEWVGDLPIMADMTIEPELGFAFDSPGGRIVLVFASSPADPDGVMTYYNDALSSLGWVGSDGSWQRGRELLDLAQVDTSTGRLWRIRLSPR